MLTTLVGGAKLEASTPLRAMSAEQLTAFWEAVEADTSLQEKLSASTDGDIDTPIEAAAVVAIAKEAGFTITTGDLLKADAQAILEMSDEDLEKVAGGNPLLGLRPKGYGGNLFPISFSDQAKKLSFSTSPWLRQNGY
jgi:predicted ribosomally synthesized peptide with nif11-like leader